MARTSNDLADDPKNVLPLTSAVFFTLFALADGEKHGYAIMQQVGLLSDDSFRMGPGTLYTTLQRLLDASLIDEMLQETERDNRKRTYRLTDAGRRLFEAELRRLGSLLRMARQKELIFRNAQ
jgi:DNA-binding PadR family transcriptional regulator